MKEAYPHSNPWPYIVPGLLLFSLVITPQIRWADKLRELCAQAFSTLEPEEVTVSPSRVVIAFDPLLDDPFVVNPINGSPNQSGFSAERAEDERTASFKAIQAKSVIPIHSAARSRSDRVYVWQPPPNWVPQLIQPLRAETAPTQKQTARSEIQAPVGTRIVRTERNSQQRKVTRKEGTSLAAPTKKGESDARPIPSPDHAPDEQSDEIAEIQHPIEWNQTPRSDSTSSPGLRETAAKNRWPTCLQLHALLETGVNDPVLATWAAEIQSVLGELEMSAIRGTSGEAQRLSRLRELVSQRVDTSSWPTRHRQLYNRILFSTLRRVDVWEPMSRLAGVELSNDTSGAARVMLIASMNELVSHLARNPYAERWGEYFELARLEGSCQRDIGVAAAAENTLRRMYSSDLNDSQRAFLDSAEFGDFEAKLRSVIATSITPGEVTNALEAYEAAPTRANANTVITLLRRWQFEPDQGPRAATIGSITHHYRNANLRIAVSEDLINRFVPAFHEYAEAVNDTILGAEVRGSNSTLANLSVRLSPDPSNIRVGLLASGTVHSNTASTKGPVTMFNQGQSKFSAGKELIINPRGIFVSRTETRVTTGNRVVGLRTELDSIPVVGWIVRTIARQQHDEQRPFLRAEILNRVRRSASQRMDREVHRRLANVEQNVNNRVMAPLVRMQLDPQPMEMRTTRERVIMRARLASPLQFGAHTPRPQARLDSVMSTQIHQTAANNIIEQLNLHGRRMTLEELASTVSEQLGVVVQVPNDQHKDTFIEFADTHPLEFDFHAGQITLTMHLAELDNGKRRWKDFSVRGYYRADVRKLDVELIRDEGIELISDRLRLRDQIALRGIFTKVFAKNTRFQLLRNAIQEQPKLRNLTVTQFEIRDGWLAIALGESDVRLVKKTDVLR